jgi:hypothetical protein
VTEIEVGLQAAIDAKPLTGLRAILADHLDEIGDPRADGYRVLEWLGRWPSDEFNYIPDTDPAPPVGWAYWASSDDDDAEIAWQWWDCWAGRCRRRHGWAGPGLPPAGILPYRARTRREADDWAALAWADLPEGVRAGVLRAAGLV